MGFLSGLFNPSKNTRSGFNQAISATNKASKITNPFYQQSVDQGAQANGMLANYLGMNGQDAQQSAYDSFMTSPAYEYQLKQGTRAIDNSAAAKGMGQSGVNLKALQKYGQNLYSGELNSYLDRLSVQMADGMAGASGLQDNANQFGQLVIGKGQSQDAGNAAAAGNIIGIGSTLASMLTGMPVGMGGGNGRV